MTDKELDPEKDDNLNQSSSDDDFDDDDFGLPSLDDDDAKESSDDSYSDSSQHPPLDEYSSTSHAEYPADNTYKKPDNKSTHKQQKNTGNVGLIIAIVLVVIIVLVAVYFLWIDSPKKQVAPPPPVIEEVVDSSQVQEVDSSQFEPVEPVVQTPTTGTVQILNSSTGKYYIIISSNIDGDLALDYANKLTKSGINVYVIEPYGGKKTYRTCLGGFDDLPSAEEKKQSITSEYGSDIWILRY